MAPKLTLAYFDIQGRAEPIRLAFAIGKIPFTNKAISHTEFAHIKSTLPMGQLPVLEIEHDNGDKEVMMQTIAILRYAGKLAGIYPPGDSDTDKIRAMKCDMYMDVIGEMAKPVDISMRGPKAYLITDTDDWTQEDVRSMQHRIKEISLPKYFGYFEKVLAASTTGWLVEGWDHITIADLLLMNTAQIFLSGFFPSISASAMDPYPLVLKHKNQVMAHPAVAAWYQAHPGSTSYHTFEFQP